MNHKDEKQKSFKNYLPDELTEEYRQATIEEQKSLRSYLLGELNEQEREEIEERLMTDEDFFKESLLVEDELIDDYVQGELSADQRKKFEATILCTPRGRQQVEITTELRQYEANKQKEPISAIAEKKQSPAKEVVPISWWRKSLQNPYLKIAASVLIVLSITQILITWRLFLDDSPSETGLMLLQEAYKDQRPLEARVLGFAYAPLPELRGNQEEKIDNNKKSRAAYLLQAEVDKHPKSLEALYGLGRYYLVTRQFDLAIEQFQNALALDPDNAEIHSDLGATYSERAVVNRDKLIISDLNKSLESLNKALAINPSLLPAYFNKALSLQRMSASTLAEEAWENYLQRDAQSEWSKEAERNLQLIREQGNNEKAAEEVFQDFLTTYYHRDEVQAWRIQSQTKEMITGAMLPFQFGKKFVSASLSDQQKEGKEILEAFKFLGELEKKRSGDRFFAELAEFYSIAGKQNAPILRQAQDALLEGYQFCLQSRYQEALQPFENARKLFLQGGNILEAKVIDYWLAYCLYYGGEVKTSSDLLEALAQHCHQHHYYWLELQAYSWLSNNSALVGEYSQGIEQDKKALRFARATDDLYMIQKISGQLANKHKFLGRLKEALEFNQQSLPSTSAYFNSRRQFLRSLLSMTDTLFALRFYSAAEAYEREALQLAANYFNEAALMHSTYRRLGQIYAGQENYPEAARVLDLSLKMLHPIENNPIYKKLYGISLLQIATMKRQMGDYLSASQYYQQAAQDFDANKFTLHSYDAHKGLLLCHLFNKDDLAIQQELPIVMNLFEQNRQKIKEEQNRNHFFDAEQSVYELAINYEYDLNNKEKSFNFVELSRARSLQDAISGGTINNNDSVAPDVILTPGSQPLALVQLQERLPVNLQLIEYAVLQNRLLIWFISKTRFEVIEQPVSIAALEATTNEYLQALPNNNDASIEREKLLATQLHDWLFAPVKDLLNKADDVVLIPDKFLFKIPFAALLSRQSNQRVVEDYTLLYSPSATVLVLCSDLARIKRQDKKTERLLSVGNPLFNQQQHQYLQDLRWAAVEARKVAAFYNAKALLIGEDAVKARIESELQQSDVIHFAAHYLLNNVSPAKSRLLLTTKSDANIYRAADDLSLQEIQTMRGLKARLAVLSSCQSGVEGYFAGEGLFGLSRAFLQAGIPLVIASQWSVESSATADLMVEFHKLRKTQNQSTTRALRQTQIAMLSHKDERYRRPFYWAAFFSIGGYAAY